MKETLETCAQVIQPRLAIRRVKKAILRATAVTGEAYMHVHMAYIAAHPLLKDADQEVAVLFRADRTIGDQRPRLCVQRLVAP